MHLFRRKPSRQVNNEPYPDFDEARWKYHLRTNAIETDSFCNKYVEGINADRKETARLFMNNDESRARIHAESALRNKRIVTALGALSPLSNALHQRSEPLTGHTSLVEVPEPARSGIVTIIFSAGHLNLKYLSETVSFLRSQFGATHIEQIQHGEGELGDLVNPSVRETLSNGPILRSEVDAEIASAVKEYFGVSVPPAQVQSSPIVETTSTPSQHAEHQLQRKEGDATRNLQTTPLSTHSSETGRPISPQLVEETQSRPLYERNIKTPSPPRGQTTTTNRMYGGSTVPPRYTSTEGGARGQDLAATVDVGSLQHERNDFKQQPEQITGESQKSFAGTADGAPATDVNLSQGHPLLLQERNQQEEQEDPEYLKTFRDSDEMLLARYEQLRSVISV